MDVVLRSLFPNYSLDFIEWDSKRGCNALAVDQVGFQAVSKWRILMNSGASPMARVGHAAAICAEPIEGAR
jgi:hypothetical protein